MDLSKLSIEDLQEYYNKFVELERYKLAERVLKEIKYKQEKLNESRR